MVEPMVPKDWFVFLGDGNAPGPQDPVVREFELIDGGGDDMARRDGGTGRFQTKKPKPKPLRRAPKDEEPTLEERVGHLEERIGHLEDQMAEVLKKLDGLDGLDKLLKHFGIE